MEEQIFNIIIHAGNARGLSYDALRAARKENYVECDKLLKESKEEMSLAHNTQTELIQTETQGKNVDKSLLLIHAQDQLMTTMAEQTLILEMIEMQKEINLLKNI